MLRKIVMNDIFIHKNDKNVVVRYISAIDSYTDVADMVWYGNGIQDKWNPRMSEYVLLQDVNSKTANRSAGKHITMPMLEFLNTFIPRDKATTDAVDTFDKLLNKDDEGYKKDICTLHSGESETDETTAPK